MKKTLVVCTAVLLSISTVACSGTPAKQAVSNTTAAAVNKMQTVDATGIVKATKIENIAIDFNASIKQILVTEGQRVKAGDKLVVLDTSDFQASIKAKELELSTAKLAIATEENNLAQIGKQISTKSGMLKGDGDPEIKKSQNDLDYAKKQYADHKEEYNNKEILYKSGAITKDELNSYSKKLDSDLNDIKSLEMALENLKYTKQKDIDDLKNELGQKTASSSDGTTNLRVLRQKVTNLENDLSLLKDKLNKTYIKQNEIVSDIKNGIVYDIGYQPVDIAGSSRKILSIIDLDSIQVEAKVAEEDIKNVKAGAAVQIIPQADKSKSYNGKVTGVSAKAQDNNGETTIPVQISIDNKDGFMLPDFNVDVKIAK